MKPGYQTTEFWHALIAQVLAFLTLMGVLGTNDSKTLEEALGKGVAAVFALIANGMIVVNYIKARHALKAQNGNNGNGHSGNGHSGANGTSSANGAGNLPVWLAVAAGLWLSAGPAQAQHVLPWRNQIESQLRHQEQLIAQLLGRQQQLAAPIIVVPPLQQLPIAGEPKQMLPIPGEPKQPLPVPGEPKQNLPPGGPPKQDLPIGGPPRQEVPAMPPALGVQPYSRYRALARPML